jgi:phage terminase large subunit GpA-like protein
MYETILEEILDQSRYFISEIKPTDWIEQNRTMPIDSAFPGKYSFNKTPYMREIIDCISQYHPAQIVALMKGAQVGGSAGFEGAIGYIISQAPGTILYLTGHADLAEEAMTDRIDSMIDNCGLRPLIKPSVLRAKNMRTGDTNKSKEFPGGRLISGAAGNHKLLRQRSVRYGFIDDFDAAKRSTKESGATTAMIEQRFAAYASQMKLFYISTPEKKPSNIEDVYLRGDQRRFMIPCTECGAFIALEWDAEIEGSKDRAGITWKLDDNGKLIEDSVGYTCQVCGGFFTDRNKPDQLKSGYWQPTATPSRPGYYSYHLSSLYAPHGMYDWLHYVYQYLEANPPGQERKEDLHKTFMNLCLGLTYEAPTETIKANALQRNQRSYEIGTVPDSLSKKDGNGHIILLTCACDLNGTEDDARLDYEIVGWSEKGSSYSITHGSIGTFIPREGAMKNKTDRERWTYHNNKERSVWKVLDEMLGQIWLTDTGRRMKILYTGIDTGHYSAFAYQYIDSTNHAVVGLKGKDDEKYIRYSIDVRSIKPAVERPKLFLVMVNKLKDELAANIKLRYDSATDDAQPAGFCNFPSPAAGKYQYNNFFSHYEAEHRVTEHTEGQGLASRWVKKSASFQNHMFDCRIYNMAIRDIIVFEIGKEFKAKDFDWSDYVSAVMSGVKS